MLRRPALLTALVVVTSTVAIPLAASPALAAQPPNLIVTTTPDRDLGNGGPASQALVRATLLARQSDGSTVLFDQGAHEIRRVDATTSVITVLAGTGSTPPGNNVEGPTTGTDALSTPLGDVAGLWATDNGDIYLWPARPSYTAAIDLYRLDHTDGQWHVAVHNTLVPNPTRMRFTAFSVAPDGTVLTFDEPHAVLRRISTGSDPSSLGTVVAGTVDTVGSTGDGGPATSSTIAVFGPIALGGDGSFVFSSSGNQVRRVAPNGTISTVAGNGSTPSNLATSTGAGQPSTAVPLQITALALSSNDATIYVTTGDASSTRTAALSFPAAGGTVGLVAGPLQTCTSVARACVGNALLEKGGNLLAASYGTVHGWPLDGSAATTGGSAVIGLDDLAPEGLTSPDGTPVSRAFLPTASVSAGRPGGGLAVATATSVKLLSDVTPGGTLSTLAPVRASALSYGTDGTLYAVRNDGPLRVVAIAPDGAVTTLVGGGSSAVDDGVSGPTAALTSVLGLEADPSSARVYFDTGSAEVFAVGADKVVHRIVGSAALGGRVPRDLAATSAGLYAVHSTDQVLRIDSDATVHLLPCPVGCVSGELEALPNGALLGYGALRVNDYFRIVGSYLVQAPSGAAAYRVPNALAGPRGVLDDGRLVSVQTVASGGLLRVVAAPPVPGDVDAPTVAITPGASSVSVDITPTATGPQRFQVLASELPSGQTWPVADLAPNGGPTPLHVDVTHLAPPGSYGAGLVHGHTYRVTVVATEQDLDVGTWVSNAPVSTDVEPLADSSAPAAPSVALTNLGTYVSLAVTPPSDADLDKVVIRKSTNGVAPASPTDGTFVGEAYYGQAAPITVSDGIDPLVTTSYRAFALDTAGNASTGTAATRPAATLATGAAVTNLAYQSGTNTVKVAWTESSGLFQSARYLAGATAPTTPTTGTGTDGTISVVKGAKVGVSLFTWTSSALTSYKRSSLVITSGTNSDVLTVTPTAAVNPGTRPAVPVALTRLGAPLAGKSVSLYRRAVGASAWTLVGTATTPSTGKLAFTVPVPTGHTDYQARYTGLGPIVGTGRTTVRQLLTETLSASTIRRSTVVNVTGTLTARRVVRIYVQRYVSGKWVNVAYANSLSNGAFKIPYRPTAAGSYTLRTFVAATSTLLAGNSVNRALRVT